MNCCIKQTQNNLVGIIAIMGLEKNVGKNGSVMGYCYIVSVKYRLFFAPPVVQEPRM